MAEGNLGSLWMSLGLKDAVSKELKKMADNMDAVDAKTKRAQTHLRQLAETDASGKGVAFLDRLKKAIGSSTKEAKELQAVFDAIRNIRGGFGDLTRGFGEKELRNYELILNRIRSSLGKISFDGLSGTGEGINAKIEAVKSAMDGLRKIQTEIYRLFETAPMLSPKAKAELYQAMNPLFNIKDIGYDYLKSGDLSKAYAWANSLDEQISKLSSSYEKFLSSEKSVVESQMGEEQQSKKATDAINAKTDALKKNEDQLKATTAAQNEKNASESKAAVAPKVQPFVENKGLDKMLNDATKTTEKVEEQKKSLSGLSDAATKASRDINEVLNKIVGGNAAGMSLDELSKKAARYSQELLELEAKLKNLKNKAETNPGKKGPDYSEVKALEAKIKNAQIYLDLIQQIRFKRDELNATKEKQPNVNTKELERGKALLDEFYGTLRNIVSKNGVDGLMVLGNMPKALGGTMREIRALLGSFSKENPLSAFANNADKAWTAISNLERQMRDLQRLMNDGKANGHKTDMLSENYYELKRRTQELYRLFGDNSDRLTDKAYMTNLFSDVTKTARIATNAIHEYNSERNIANAAEKAVNKEIASEQRQQQKAREDELKALSDYIKRYTALVEQKRALAEKGGITLFEKNDSGLKNIRAEIDSMLARLGKVREDITLYQQAIGRGNKESVDFGQKGLREAEQEAEKLMSSIQNLQNVYDTLRMSQATAKDITGGTLQEQAQRDIQKRMSEYYSNLEKSSAKQAAQVARDSAKAKREDIAAEKQRQTEIKNAERRYDSLGNKVRQLRSEYSRGISSGADVSKTEAEIHRLISIMRQLQNIKDNLSSPIGWKGYLGKLGNIGSGHDTTLASRVLQDQRAVNREVQKGVDLERKRQQEVANTAAKVRSDLARAFEQAKEKASGLSPILQDLKSLIMQGGIVYGIRQFTMSIIQTGGELEKQHIALQSILGDIQNANTMFSQIKQLALQSPFTFSELNRDVKQLAAYGVEYDKLYDTTKRLADMSAGLGTSFERIALAFGQVRSRGWLDGKELRQISYAGIPLLQKLSEYYSKKEGRKVSTSEIKTRISARDVDFEDVKNVFWEMTDAGGQFYNMQLVLSETLLGRFNKLKDAWEIMLSEFASGNSIVGKGLKGILDIITNLVLALHSYAPTIAAAFSGPLLAKAFGRMSGGLDKALLSVKGGMATDLTRKALEGKKLKKIEKELLADKNRITLTDIKNLATAKALTQTELRRLYVSGKITQEMYKQGMALTKQNATSNGMNMRMFLQRGWANIKSLGEGSRWGALGMLIGNGLKGGLTSIYNFFGGLPGIAITAGLTIFSWYQQKSAELKQKMEQTAHELEDRAKQLAEFLRDNNAQKIVSGGDEKAISNAIEAYEAKLREIAPYSASAFIMSAKEKQDHKERLAYLAAQLELLQKANAIAKDKEADEDTFEGIDDKTQELAEVAKKLETANAKLKQIKFTANDVDDFNRAKADLDKYAAQLADKYRKAFKNIATSETEQEAYKIIRENEIGKLGLSEEASAMIRSALDRALGLRDTTMEKAFSDKVMNMLNRTFPAIADAIKTDKKLDEASKKKVENIMRSATAELSYTYGYWETELQRLLASSNFVAKIRIVTENMDSDEKLEDLEKRLYNNVMEGHAGSQVRVDQWIALKPYLKGKNNLYDVNNAVQTALNTLWNQLKTEKKASKKGKGDQTAYNEISNKFNTLKDAVYNATGYVYVPEDKKSNKTKGGDKKDTALEALRQRVDDFKAARQWYQKYKGLNLGESESIKRVKDLFPNLDWSKIDLSKYTESLDSIMPGKGFWNTTDRKKFQTQVKRERAEWIYSEIEKPEAERLASNFKEALEKGIRQVDLAKELYEKTGNKAFSDQAFKDGAIWDAKTLSLAEDFKKMTGEDINIGWSDADAKKNLEGVQNGYELWQKITTLVKDKYVKSLQQAAEILEQTATYEEKIATINAKYEGLINTEKDPKIRARYEIQRDKEVGQVKLDQFKNSSDYLNFYGAIVSLGMDKAAAIGTEIRKNINDALQKGAIDAREYAKEIKQLEEQLSKLTKPRPSFLNGGLDGIVNAKKERANEQITLGSSKYNEAKRKYDEAKINGNSLGMALAEQDMEAAKAMMKGGEELLSGALEMETSISTLSMIIHGINDTVQGLNDSFQDIKDTASALGVDTESNSWTDANAFFSGFASSSASATKAFDSFKSGNIGGVISGAVGSVTGWIKSYAAAHDAKLDRQIKLAERQITELQNLRTGIKSAIENTLGGVYAYKQDNATTNKLKSILGTTKAKYTWQQYIIDKNSRKYGKDTKESAKKALEEPDNAYESQRALLLAQRDEMQKQLTSEQRKKKKDDDKIADLKQQLVEMNTNIENLAKDYLKEVYGVDLKSWASQLTDAVVGAWEKGEDAIDAYKNKAKQLVKDLTKNILSQKLMETALQPALNMLTSLIENSKDGRLNESNIPDIADKIINGTENTVHNMTAIMDELRKKGYDFSELGTGSVTNSIQNITEETADILASYLNAVRSDVSVNREQVRQMLETMNNNLPKMGHIQEAQLGQLKQLVILSTARNEKLDSMLDWMSAVTTSGRKKINIS